MKTQRKIFQNYRKLRGDFLEGPDYEKTIANLFKYRYYPFLKKRENEKVLEIGCGNGNLLLTMKNNGFKHLEGVDLSPLDIELAKNKTKINSLYCDDIFHFLENKTDYDIIISKAVLEHIKKDKAEKFVQLIYSALKPNGIALIHIPNMDWLFSSHERYMDFTHENGYTRESIRDLFRLNFEIDKVEVHPVSFLFMHSLKQIIIFGILRPILIWILRLFFRILGEGGHETWFEYRSLLLIARK